MKPLIIFSLIIVAIILLIIAFLYFRPFIIRHDTTMLFTGGLGSGKTLESVKLARVLILKNIFIHYTIGNLKRRCKNAIRKFRNKLRINKYNKLAEKNVFKANEYRRKKPLLNYEKIIKKPLLYSNIPVKYRDKPFKFFSKKKFSQELNVHHITLLAEIREYSVVLIDEFPQFISQFEWDEPLVQKNCNEFITFFRHYIGGYLITNAQSEDEIECHFRRKLNIGTWCFNMKKWPLPIKPFCWFYTVRMCDFMLSENITTMSTTYIEENTKLHFGLFPRKAYDSRCYSIRYDRIKKTKLKKWKKLKTNKVLKLKPYISPLDTETTEQQIGTMKAQITKLERNKDDHENNGRKTQPQTN